MFSKDFKRYQEERLVRTRCPGFDLVRSLQNGGYACELGNYQEKYQKMSVHADIAVFRQCCLDQYVVQNNM